MHGLIYGFGDEYSHGGLPCKGKTKPNWKPFGTWRKPLLNYAEGCRLLNDSGVIVEGHWNTPLTPSLYSDPLGEN
tara:strand:- start:1120 stop:1344 length:225 start_codon:yes stop_codon:yes gene_type:complete